MRLFAFRYTGLIVLTVLFVSLSAFAAPPKYNLTALGGLPNGYSVSQPSALNDSGQVVGFARNGQVGHAFFWSNVTMQDLGTFGGTESWGAGINNAGQVVGCARNSRGDRHAFIWQNGSMQDLGTLNNNSSSYANGINNSGQIVGWSWDGYNGMPSYKAFLWENGSMQDIGGLSQTSDNYAKAINNSGQITGESDQAFLWQNNVMSPIGAGGYGDSGVALNDSGQVLIRASSGSGIWQNGSMQLIPALPNYTKFTTPYGINDSGQVVGTAESYDFIPQAFIYQGGAIYKLGDYLTAPFLGSWYLQCAYDINNKGQIVAMGYGPNGATAVLLTPVPEPGTIFLLCLGAAAIRKRW